MASTIEVKQLFTGKRYEVFHLTSYAVAAPTAEADAIKMDISTFTDPRENPCTYTAVDRIEYSVWGFNYVTLEWDHTTDDEIAVLSGQGVMDWSQLGGNVDPRTAGATGDIVLTTDGTTDGSGYDITIYVRPKA
jgi:hypothetical protein